LDQPKELAKSIVALGALRSLHLPESVTGTINSHVDRDQAKADAAQAMFNPTARPLAAPPTPREPTNTEPSRESRRLFARSARVLLREGMYPLAGDWGVEDSVRANGGPLREAVSALRGY